VFCREHVAQLRDAVDDIRTTGATLAAIGTGDLDYARHFAEERGIDFPLMVDETSTSYRAVGTRKGTKRGLVSPKVLARGAQAVAGGNLQGKVGRAPMVLGACHVIRPDGSVPFAWINGDFADNAPIDEVLAALR
jgi:peroxiredoxin